MKQREEKGGLISSRMESSCSAKYSATPPFPRHLNVELSNVCNHACTFCAYSLMERSRGNIDVQKLEGWLEQAYDLGCREVGLHSGAEPFASPHLEHFVEFTKKTGYEYVYISTNGSLATPERMGRVIDRGIDSIKFSINAGDRKTYATIHGKDHFEKVVEMVRWTSRYRGSGRKPYLAVSFVIVPANETGVEKLRATLDGMVDEFIAFRASNQNGQMTGVGETPPKQANQAICSIPFTKLHISWEGFVRLCCNDYENLLALEDLNKMSLHEAVYSERFQEIRRRHLANDLAGTLCHNCKNNCLEPVQPLNPELYFRTHKTDAGPPVSRSGKILREPQSSPEPQPR